jgi:putative ATPase
MIEGGEDVKFIARRLLICASEDIGNANPTALVLATSTFQAVERIGMPESRILLSQCVVYLASSPKSNASYIAIKAAQTLVQETGDLPVPLHLRNAPTSLMSKLGYGKGYSYDHDAPSGFSEQECMPAGLEGKQIYNPGNNPREKSMRSHLKSLWKEKYGY